MASSYAEASSYAQGFGVTRRLGKQDGATNLRRGYSESVRERGGAASRGRLFGQLRDLLVFVFLDEDAQHVHE
jgi:hypothetical protein